MCALIDANVVAEVFARDDRPDNRPEAGRKFFDWIHRRGTLVAGGVLLKELAESSPAFSPWFQQAIQAGRAIQLDDQLVEAKAGDLEKAGACRSNDAHVIAAADIGGARLLYSNDQDLQDDFKNKELIDNPRGKVYSTLRSRDFTSGKRSLLNDKKLCARGNR